LRSGDLSGLFKKYENLFEQYLQTRRKYHDFYHRTNNNQQLKKNEDNYYRSLKQLRDFEESLTEWQRLKFKEHLSIYKEELTYENAHGVDGNHDEIPQDGQFEDPHLTITQVESQDYVSDEEESVGTMEDYNRLKGIQ